MVQTEKVRRAIIIELNTVEVACFLSTPLHTHTHTHTPVKYVEDELVTVAGRITGEKLSQKEYKPKDRRWEVTK